MSKEVQKNHKERLLQNKVRFHFFFQILIV